MSTMNFGDARLPSRFWDKVTPDSNSGCWLWIGKLDRYGYAKTSVKTRAVTGHRMAYLAVAPIPDGLTLDHLCRVRNCVNPAHLEPVTNVENVMRGESVWAVNARKTECHKGHPLDEANTYVTTDGFRQCRKCKADEKVRRRSRARAAGHPFT